MDRTEKKKSNKKEVKTQKTQIKNIPNEINMKNSDQTVIKNSIEELQKERNQERRQILIHFSQCQFSQALICCRNLGAITNKILKIQKTEDIKELLEGVADKLLLVKALIKTDKIQSARETLLAILPVVLNKFDEDKLDFKELKENAKKDPELQNYLKQIGSSSKMDDIIPSQKKMLFNTELKKRTNLISTLANLFYAVGDFKNCEKLYVKYVKTVETNLSENHLQTSNCYYLVGVFYLQHVIFIYIIKK